MTQDFIDQQANVRERVRKLEIGPRPLLLHTPAPWDPAYGTLTFLELVAYTMLPFCAFLPGTLPAIPPQAQHYAQEWWSDYAHDGKLAPVRREQTRHIDAAEQAWDHGYREARAFTRALLCSGGLVLPTRYATWPTNIHRVEGLATDFDGHLWRSQPNGRALYWAPVALDAAPPAEPLPDFPAPAYSWTMIEGKLGDPSPHTGPAGRTYYNYPSTGEFAGDPGIADARTGRYCYQLQPQYQLLSHGNPGYIPPSGIPAACLTTSTPDIAWGPLGTGENHYNAGIRNLSGPLRDHIDCDQNTIDHSTNIGYWNIAAFQLDGLAGLYLQRPPEFYMGQDTNEFSRDADATGGLISYPGWEEWTSRIQEWCLNTSDWMDWVAPFFSRYRPRWRQPGLPSEHWQRMPVYMPWLGGVEYRIWQRVMYLRGRLYNPFHWGNGEIAPMPPGVAPQSVSGRAAVSGTNDQAYPLGFKPAGGSTPDGPRPLRLAIAAGTEMNVSGSRYDTPEYLVLDGARFPVKTNPPYVP